MVVVLGLLACSSGPRTAVYVVVDAQREVRERIDRFELVLYDTEGDVTLEVERDGRLVDPFRLELTPAGNDASRTWRVEVSARDSSGARIAEGRLRGGYVEGEVLDVVLCLEDTCRGEFCQSCGEGFECTTCKSGACVSAEAVLQPLRNPQPSCPGLGDMDAGADASPVADTDPTCVPVAENCMTAADEDCEGDGGACEDSGCAEQPCGANGLVCRGGSCVCSIVGGENCTTAADEDCDGEGGVCENGCNGQPCNGIGGSCVGTACVTPENCAVGGDEDGDGFADCDDADCCGSGACQSRRIAQLGAPFWCCGNTAVNIRTDANHCGGCGIRCASGQCFGDSRPGQFEFAHCNCTSETGSGSACPSGQSCARRTDPLTALRCQCMDDSECGSSEGGGASGRRCLQTAGGGHNYCGYY